MIAATRWSLTLAVFSIALPIHAESSSIDRPTNAQLTIDRLYSLPHLVGTAPSALAWSADGRQLAFLWNDAGFNFRDVWVIDVEDPELVPTRVTSMPQTDRPDPSTVEDPLALAEAEETWERDSGVTAVAWHPDGTHLLVTFRGDLWRITRGFAPQRLTHSTAPERRAAYSPDGRTLAFLRDGGDADQVLVVANFTPVPRSGYGLGVPPADEWELVASSDDVGYGGSGASASQSCVPDGDAMHGFDQSIIVDIPPLSLSIYRRRAEDGVAAVDGDVSLQNPDSAGS